MSYDLSSELICSNVPCSWLKEKQVARSPGNELRSESSCDVTRSGETRHCNALALSALME